MRRKTYLILILFFSTVKLLSNSYFEAERAYAAAEKASTYEEREKGFNLALSNYLKESCDHPLFWYNVANCYYQLSKPGYAIWYYEKALKQTPRNKKIKQNLLKAKEIASVDVKQQPHVIPVSLLPTHFLSTQEKNRVSLTLAILLTLSLSTLIWFSKKLFKGITISILTVAFCFFLSWSIEGSLKAHEGLIVESAILRCDAAEHYESVNSEPLAGGCKVVILELSEDGKWAKVKAAKDKMGFVPLEKLRML